MEQLKKYLLAEISTDLYDTICEIEREEQEEKRKNENLSVEEETMTREQMVKYEIEDFLYYLELNDEKLKQYKEDGNDFWNDQTDTGGYWCDLANEWADSQIDIYNYDLWRKAQVFSNYIEDALDEFGFDKERGIIGLFQMGQYQFYSNLSNEILISIEKYVSEEL